MSIRNQHFIRQQLNRYDIILIITIMVVSIILFLSFMFFAQQTNHLMAHISIDKKTVGLIDLDTNGIHEYPAPLGPVRIEVLNGKIRMLESSCPDQLCVHQGFLDNSNGSIICIPNHLVIELDQPTAYDGVSR